MIADYRRALRVLLTFVALVVVAGWPLVSFRALTSRGLTAVLSPLLQELAIGRGGRVSIRPAAVSEVRRPGEHVSSDAELLLSVVGTTRQLPVGINLRRDFYLPLVMFVAAVLAAPVARARRAIALTLGLPVAFYLCVGGLYLTVCWLFAHWASGVYPLTHRELELLDTLVGTFLMPPTLRFFVPLLIALGMVWLLGERRAARLGPSLRNSSDVGTVG